MKLLSCSYFFAPRVGGIETSLIIGVRSRGYYRQIHA